MDIMKRDVKHEKDFSYISPSHIRAARGWLGWNLDETSEKTGLSKKTISRYEVGRHDITHASAAKIYTAFLNNGVELAPDGLRSK
jgi:predicted transcriptional regulator